MHVGNVNTFCKADTVLHNVGGVRPLPFLCVANGICNVGEVSC